MINLYILRVGAKNWWLELLDENVDGYIEPTPTLIASTDLYKVYTFRAPSTVYAWALSNIFVGDNTVISIGDHVVSRDGEYGYVYAVNQSFGYADLLTVVRSNETGTAIWESEVVDVILPDGRVLAQGGPVSKTPHWKKTGIQKKL